MPASLCRIRFNSLLCAESPVGVKTASDCRGAGLRTPRTACIAATHAGVSAGEGVQVGLGGGDAPRPSRSLGLGALGQLVGGPTWRRPGGPSHC
jgi:hypothetical protein